MRNCGSKQGVPIIGLVGGVGSGKSAVAGLLAGLGCDVIDADTLAKRLLDEPRIRGRLVERWGARILGEDGCVDRRVVADLVFADPAELRFLEEQLHPPVVTAIRRAIASAVSQGRVGVVIDAPKLLEAGLGEDCDVIVFVEVGYETRRERLEGGRGWDQQELDRRENQQMPLDLKREHAHYVVQNEGEIADLRNRVEALFQQILRERMRSDTPR